MYGGSLPKARTRVQSGNAWASRMERNRNALKRAPSFFIRAHLSKNAAHVFS
jgi:hypothetical protein